MKISKTTSILIITFLIQKSLTFTNKPSLISKIPLITLAKNDSVSINLNSFFQGYISEFKIDGLISEISASSIYILKNVIFQIYLDKKRSKQLSLRNTPLGFLSCTWGLPLSLQNYAFICKKQSNNQQIYVEAYFDDNLDFSDMITVNIETPNFEFKQNQNIDCVDMVFPYQNNYEHIIIGCVLEQKKLMLQDINRAMTSSIKSSYQIYDLFGDFDKSAGFQGKLSLTMLNDTSDTNFQLVYDQYFANKKTGLQNFQQKVYLIPVKPKSFTSNLSVVDESFQEIDLLDLIEIDDIYDEINQLDQSAKKSIAISTISAFSDYTIYQLNIPNNLGYKSVSYYCYSEVFFILQKFGEKHLQANKRQKCFALPEVYANEEYQVYKLRVNKNNDSTFTIGRLSKVAAIYYTVDLKIPTIIGRVDIYENYEWSDRSDLNLAYITSSSSDGISGMVYNSTNGELYPIYASRNKGLIILTDTPSVSSTTLNGEIQLSLKKSEILLSGFSYRQKISSNFFNYGLIDKAVLEKIGFIEQKVSLKAFGVFMGSVTHNFEVVCMANYQDFISKYNYLGCDQDYHLIDRASDQTNQPKLLIKGYYDDWIDIPIEVHNLSGNDIEFFINDVENGALDNWRIYYKNYDYLSLMPSDGKNNEKMNIDFNAIVFTKSLNGKIVISVQKNGLVFYVKIFQKTVLKIFIVKFLRIQSSKKVKNCWKVRHGFQFHQQNLQQNQSEFQFAMEETGDPVQENYKFFSMKYLSGSSNCCLTQNIYNRILQACVDNNHFQGFDIFYTKKSNDINAIKIIDRESFIIESNYIIYSSSRPSPPILRTRVLQEISDSFSENGSWNGLQIVQAQYDLIDLSKINLVVINKSMPIYSFADKTSFLVYRIDKAQKKVNVKMSLELSPIFGNQLDLSDINFCQFADNDFIFYSIKNGKIFGKIIRNNKEEDIYHYLDPEISTDEQPTKILNFKCLISLKLAFVLFQTESGVCYIGVLRIGELYRNDRRIVLINKINQDYLYNSENISLGKDANELIYFLHENHDEGNSYAYIKEDIHMLMWTSHPFIKFNINGPRIQVLSSSMTGSQVKREFSILVKNSKKSVEVPIKLELEIFKDKAKLEQKDNSKLLDMYPQEYKLRNKYKLSEFVDISGPFKQAQIDIPSWFNDYISLDTNLTPLYLDTDKSVYHYSSHVYDNLILKFQGRRIDDYLIDSGGSSIIAILSTQFFQNEKKKILTLYDVDKSNTAIYNNEIVMEKQALQISHLKIFQVGSYYFIIQSYPSRNQALNSDIITEDCIEIYQIQESELVIRHLKTIYLNFQILKFKIELYSNDISDQTLIKFGMVFLDSSRFFLLLKIFEFSSQQNILFEMKNIRLTNMQLGFYNCRITDFDIFYYEQQYHILTLIGNQSYQLIVQYNPNTDIVDYSQNNGIKLFEYLGNNNLLANLNCILLEEQVAPQNKGRSMPFIDCVVINPQMILYELKIYYNLDSNNYTLFKNDIFDYYLMKNIEIQKIILSRKTINLATWNKNTNELMLVSYVRHLKVSRFISGVLDFKTHGVRDLQNTFLGTKNDKERLYVPKLYKEINKLDKVEYKIDTRSYSVGDYTIDFRVFDDLRFNQIYLWTQNQGNNGFEIFEILDAFKPPMGLTDPLLWTIWLIISFFLVIIIGSVLYYKRKWKRQLLEKYAQKSLSLPTFHYKKWNKRVSPTHWDLDLIGSDKDFSQNENTEEGEGQFFHNSNRSRVMGGDQLTMKRRKSKRRKNKVQMDRNYNSDDDINVSYSQNDDISPTQLTPCFKRH